MKLTSFVLVSGLMVPHFITAEPLFWPDYEALFETHASQVKVSEAGVRILDLGNGVTVWEDTSDSPSVYRAMDRSKFGAVGCFLWILMETEAFTRKCPDVLPAENLANLRDFRDRTLIFYAENSYPSRTIKAVRERYEGGVEEYGKQFGGGKSCQLDGDAMRLMIGVTSSQAEESMSESLSLPRLPVANPCL